MPGQLEHVTQFLGKDIYGDALEYNTLEDGVKVRVALSSEMQEILLDVKNSCNDTNMWSGQIGKRQNFSFAAHTNLNHRKVRIFW